MLKELPKVGDKIISLDDVYCWETDTRYFSIGGEYKVEGISRVSGNPYVRDNHGRKSYIDEAVFDSFELVEDSNDTFVNFLNFLGDITDNVTGEKKFDFAEDESDFLEIESREGGFRDVLLVHSNYTTWKDASDYKEPFYMSLTEEDCKENAIGLTIGQAKQLRDYLSERIEYLEGGN